MRQGTPVPQRPDDTKRAPPAQAGKGAGVAVRMHLQRAHPALLDEKRGPPLAHPFADLNRGVADREGGSLHRLGAVAEHCRDREHLAAQVDRGRAGVGDPLDLGIQPVRVPLLALGLPDRERHAKRASHSEQRRAPHDQPDDRVDKLIDGVEVEDGDPVRKGSLVNGNDVTIPPADNVIKYVVAHGFDATLRRREMLLPDARAAIVNTCQDLSRAGLVVGTAGNVSVREGDLVAVTPSGVRYAELTPELIGVHRLDGAAVEASLAPTSEMPLHLAIYTARPEVGAVVHTHSPAATALSTLVDEVPAVHYYMAMFGGPVRVAPYATYGTDELARNTVAALHDRTACLLGNHGAVTVGADLVTAHDKSEYLEWLCDVYLRASSAGTPRLLPAAEIAAVAEKLAGYGQHGPT